MADAKYDIAGFVWKPDYAGLDTEVVISAYIIPGYTFIYLSIPIMTERIQEKAAAECRSVGDVIDDLNTHLDRQRPESFMRWTFSEVSPELLKYISTVLEHGVQT